MDAVLARWKFGVARVELEWDLDFKLAYDLRACSGRANRERKYQDEEQREQLMPSPVLVVREILVGSINGHGGFSPRSPSP